MEDSDDAYQILGVSSGASGTDIKKAYRKLALKNHPDKQTTEGDRERAHSVFAKISNAYQILGDEESRKQYDLRKKFGSPGTGGVDQQPTYTYYEQDPPQQSSRTHSSSPRKNYTTYQTSKPTTRTRVTRTSTGPGGTTTHHQDDGDFTFSFTSNTFNPEFDDPYEMFQKMFREEYGRDFDTMSSSPASSKASSNPHLVSPTEKKKKKKVPVSSPLRRDKNSSNKFDMGSPKERKQKLPTSAMFSSPLQKGKQSVVAPTEEKKTKAASSPLGRRAPQQSGGESPIVSQASSTKTICRADGTQEVVTETTISRADGSVETSTHSSRTPSRVSKTTVSTTSTVRPKKVPSPRRLQAATGNQPSNNRRVMTWTTTSSN